MGCYVNPVNELKEKWLAENSENSGNPFGLIDLKSFVGKSTEEIYEKLKENQCLPVVLVDNGLFTAAAVAYCFSEFEVFTEPSDRRPKMIFRVKLDKLKKVSDVEDYLKRMNS